MPKGYPKNGVNTGWFKKGHIFRFKKGSIPHNKGKKGWVNSGSFKKGMKKGIIKPNSGSFKKGHIPWNKDKNQSEETKKKISKNNPRYWLGKKRPPRSEETKKKISEGIKGEKHWNWQDGKSFEPYGPYWTENYKASIRERDNFTCGLCGKYPAFCVHHIDYNKLNPDPEMKITLCSNCHGKVGHNKDYWQNYFTIKKRN